MKVNDWQGRGGSRRPRLRRPASLLRRLAHRIYPEPTCTITVVTGDWPPRTFVDCRELRR